VPSAEGGFASIFDAWVPMTPLATVSKSLDWTGVLGSSVGYCFVDRVGGVSGRVVGGEHEDVDPVVGFRVEHLALVDDLGAWFAVI